MSPIYRSERKEATVPSLVFLVHIFKHNGENITQNFAHWKYYRLCEFGCGVSLGLERWYPGLEV
jgi:hypothetical protein